MGGPAWPQTPQIRYYNAEIGEKYTLVIWEQRGAGKSYSKNPEPEILNLDQIVSDGHELTTWLKEEFPDKDIYLAGYSWGSLVGVELANRFPQDYAAYIGICQYINKQRAMKIAQDWLRVQAEKANDQDDLAKLDSLKNASFYASQTDQFFQQWLLLNKYKGAVYNMEAEEETQKAMKQYADYEGYDWFGVWRASTDRLAPDMNEANVLDIQSLDLPVFLLEGRHDWNVPSVLATEWLDHLDSPKKKVFWFESSGHGPLEEEPKKFNQVVMSILDEME